MGLFVPTEALGQQIFTDIVAAAPGVAGILNGAKWAPYISNVLPTSKTVLADLTISPDANLALTAVTWTAYYRRTDGGIAIETDSMMWQLALLANVCTCYGIALTNSAGAFLLGCWPLDTPHALSDTMEAFSTVGQLCYGGGDFGELSVVV